MPCFQFTADCFAKPGIQADVHCRIEKQAADTHYAFLCLQAVYRPINAAVLATRTHGHSRFAIEGDAACFGRACMCQYSRTVVYVLVAFFLQLTANGAFAPLPARQECLVHLGCLLPPSQSHQQQQHTVSMGVGRQTENIVRLHRCRLDQS